MWFDGNAVLRELLARSEYGSAAQAVAALTRWAHPTTVRQTGNRGLFPVIRCRVRGREDPARMGVAASQAPSSAAGTTATPSGRR